MLSVVNTIILLILGFFALRSYIEKHRDPKIVSFLQSLQIKKVYFIIGYHVVIYLDSKQETKLDLNDNEFGFLTLKSGSTTIATSRLYHKELRALWKQCNMIEKQKEDKKRDNAIEDILNQMK